MSTNRVTNSLNISLLAGIALKGLPIAVLQPILARTIRIMQSKHSPIFQRLSSIPDPTFIIDPVDIPFSFYMRIDELNPTLTAIEKNEYYPVAATIKGTFDSLMKMLSGKMDGDAAFFNREIVIEGKTEAIVALRNALDSEDINVIADLLSFFKPIQHILSPLVDKIESANHNINSTLANINDAITSKLSQEVNYQKQRIEELEEKVEELTKVVSRNTRPPIRKKEIDTNSK